MPIAHRHIFITLSPVPDRGEGVGGNCRRGKHAKGRRVSTRKLRERARFQALSQAWGPGRA